MTAMDTSYTSAIAASGVAVTLGDTRVLEGLDVSIAPARWTSVVGPNGAGKSTLLKTLAGLLPHSGEVRLMGKPLASIPRRVRAQQMAWLGQGEPGAEDLTVLDVVMLGRMPHRSWLTGPSETDEAAVEQALRLTHSWQWRHRALGSLSGGERQRVLLARALAVQARTLLMDEPLANLDPPHQVDWLDLVRNLVHSGCTVVSVLHELSMALHADDMLIMAAGRIVHQGACADELTHRALEMVFDNRIAVYPLNGQWVVCPA